MKKPATTNSQAHTITISPVPASCPGALPGFLVTCSCGYTEGNTIRSNAELNAQAHLDWAKRNNR